MNELRVLHLSISDKVGGAARAAHRIYRAQQKAGADSHMLVINRTEAAPTVHAPLSNAQRIAHRAKLFFGERIIARQQTPGNQVVHSVNFLGNGIAKWINRSDFDVVNLHWVGGGLLSIEEIGRINKPIFWTMHDMWPFSGAEHYDDLDAPERYTQAYTAANRPSSYTGLDIDAWTWGRKMRAWRSQRFHLISPSKWLADCAANSTLMHNQPCIVIPNCVDTTVFKPIERGLARKILNLDTGKRYILYGAMFSTADRRKGFHLLQPSLKALAESPGIKGSTELLVFGANTPESPPDMGLPTRYMGIMNDDVSLALLYSAADVFVAPSMQDNLPNTLVEAMCCGTPCAAFAVGGMIDLISSDFRGRLATPYDCLGLTRAILQLLDHPDAVSLSKRCSADAANEYNERVVAKEYLRAYSRVVNEGESNKVERQ